MIITDSVCRSYDTANPTVTMMISDSVVLIDSFCCLFMTNLPISIPYEQHLPGWVTHCTN